MQKITFICVGALKEAWVTEGCEHYVDRIKNEAAFEVLELPASKERDPQRQQEEESERILNALEKRKGLVWVLDETGKSFTSESFAKELSTVADRGEHVIFVLGGAYGMTKALKDNADRLIALSGMTFPHELCRLIFVEQLYRALQIKKGTGYHH